MIRSYLGDLARARRKFTTSSTRKHGHIDPPKSGEELVYTHSRTILTTDDSVGVDSM